MSGMIHSVAAYIKGLVMSVYDAIGNSAGERESRERWDALGVRPVDDSQLSVEEMSDVELVRRLTNRKDLDGRVLDNYIIVKVEREE